MLEVADRPEREFTPRDEAILAQLGQLASVAIAKSQAYTRERHIAQVLQRSLLPPSLPTVPGLAAAVRFIAAGEGIEVGGDFYDFFRARGTAVAALIGDVCGKGPEAASVTALARHTLRAAAAYEARPSAVLALLHRALREARDDGRFCTVAYCDFEVRAGRRADAAVAAAATRCRSCCARAGAVEPVGQLGTLLGADVEPVLTDVAVELAPGDLVVLYTDGVTEVRAGRKEIFGHRDLAALLGRCAGLPADARRPARPGRRARGGRAGGRATTSRSSSSAPARSPTPPILAHFPALDDPRRQRMAEPESGAPGDGAPPPDTSAALLRELVAHLRQNRTDLREEWARRITEAQLLTALTPEEIFSEATSVYDNYVEVLETGSVEALQDYARNLSERIIPRGVETDEVLGIVLLLRDVLARSLFEKYQDDFNRVLDAYEPAANRIANTVAVNFVQERERVIRQQQEAIRELSTPVLQVRERLLILPIIGVLDSQRARQLTEQLLRGDPRQPRQGRRDRHHRRADDRLDGGQPPRADRRGVAPDGRERDHHRPVVGDRPDARHDRRRPVQGQRGRRPAGRHRGGRAAARLRGLARRRGAAGRGPLSARAHGRPDPQAGPVPDRLDPGGAHRHRRASACRTT